MTEYSILLVNQHFTVLAEPEGDYGVEDKNAYRESVTADDDDIQKAVHNKIAGNMKNTNKKLTMRKIDQKILIGHRYKKNVVK